MEKETIFKKYEDLRKKLKREVFGQNEAIDEVVDALLHLHFSPAKESYKGLFTFLGPHNSGKVYLATLLAKYCSDFDGIKIFDMAEFTDPNDQKKLIGSEGSLTNFVKNNPRSIVVFKDIEKCDNVIQLAILHYIKMNTQERGVDFSHILIIFTSTIGSSLLKREDFLRFYHKERLKAQAKIVEFIAKEKKIIYDVVESAIDPELLSVIVQNYIVLFRHLPFEAIVKIGEKRIKESIETIQKRGDVTIKIEKRRDFAKLLTLSFAPYINARRVHRKIPDILLDIIYDATQKLQIFPKKITFHIHPDASKILENIDQVFLQKLTKRNETVSLAWEFTQKDAELSITLRSAKIKRLPLYASPTEKPYIAYSTISFEDVAGQRHVKKELKEIITVLKNPQKVKKFGISMPKGMLLYGPKGVGKTLLSYAFAKEAGMPYLLLRGADIFDTNLVHQAYEKAKELSPAIVFLDEIDTKILLDSSVTTISYDHIAREIDAVSDEEFVFTIATATDKDVIDKNLLASERIDILIEVPELDMEARKFFIKKILEKPNDGKIDIEKVARYMSGLSGYEMQRIAKEAALYVLRKNLKVITEDILIEQINNVKYGQKIDKKRIRNIEKDLRKTAYHEAGHAVLSYILLPDVKIEQVTITPRAEALGFVSYSDEFITNVSKDEIFNDICVALAGRIAKIKKFPDEGEDTGAVQDLEQATWEAYNAIANFGMDEKIGYINIDTLNQNVSKEYFKEEVEERIKIWMEKATKKSTQLVEKHWDKIEKVAQALIKKEMIDAEELRKIMES